MNNSKMNPITILFLKFIKFSTLFIILIIFVSKLYGTSESDSLIKMYKQTFDKHKKADIAFEIALFYINFNIDSSKIFAGKCNYLSKFSDYKEGQAKANYILAISHILKNELKQAYDYLEKSRFVLRYSSDKITYGRILLGLGNIFLMKREFDKSLFFLTKAKNLFERKNEKDLYNRVCIDIAKIYSLINDTKNELTIRENLYNWNVIKKDTLNLAHSAYTLSLFLSTKGEQNKAIHFLKIAQKLFYRIKNYEYLAYTYQSLGLSNYHLGNFEIAITYSLKALQLYEKLKLEISQANDFNNIGMIYFEMKNYQESRKYYGKALLFYNKFGNKFWKAATLGNIGLIEVELGNQEKALSYFNEALLLSNSVGNKPGIGNSLQYIGAIHQRKRNYDSAFYYFENSLQIFEQLNDIDGITGALNSLAELNYIKEDYLKTNFYGERALLLLKNTSAKLRLQKLYNLLSFSYSKQNNFKKAYRYKLIASELKDSILDYNKTRQIGRIEANFEIKRQLEVEKRIKIEKARAWQEAKIYKDNVEYFGIILFVITSIFIVFNYRKKNIKTSTLDKFVFIIFLLIFEFVSILLDSPINNISKGDAVLNLFSAVILAVVLTPIHNKLKDFLTKKLHN